MGDRVVANDCAVLKYLVDRNVFAICSTKRNYAELLPKSLVACDPASACGSPSGAIDTLVSRPCSLAFRESMRENGELRQEPITVHDVLNLFRDKIVHDVMNPDTYELRRVVILLADRRHRQWQL